MRGRGKAAGGQRQGAPITDGDGVYFAAAAVGGIGDGKIVVLPNSGYGDVGGR